MHIDFTTAIQIGSIIITFLGGYTVGVSKWWDTKTPAEKADTITDGVEIVSDGKVEPKEVKTFFSEHVFKKE